ncbi:MAG: tRNA preQ1(34) S-adenosylmethionine ribosyltransferase-isomerase QueA [Spirochaetes bacterium]|nr:tRNA preQ1(34) S-adenosylmethionine ribosyltransferase-isomerase QueA [Spirochaetota bacterium]
MKTSDFSFDLPERLIAQSPSDQRGADRLFVLRRRDGRRTHVSMSVLPDFVPDGAVMVFNDSRVRKARVFGQADTGARVEFLFTRRTGHSEWEAMCGKLRKQTVGKKYSFPEGIEAEIVAEGADVRILRLSRDFDEAWFERNGHVPLPPYIKRADGTPDAERYQTVYARDHGSVAAPTAGLHFTDALLGALDARGVRRVFITLHVGMGTFMPVRSERVEDHRMHTERFSIPTETAREIETAKREGRPVIAIGTTSVRTMESAWEGDGFAMTEGETDIFITPGYRFKVVDGLFTNFHTPESTLLMLASAFAGREFILSAYDEAVRENYRFFSYGDAMLIL